MTRAQYVQWCKDRALAYLKEGDIPNAITSMMSDMDKRPDTRVSPILRMLGMQAIISSSIADARRFIEGFN